MYIHEKLNLTYNRIQLMNRIDLTSFWVCRFPVVFFLHYPHISGTTYQRADVNHKMTSGLTFSIHDTRWISKGELGVLPKAILTLGCPTINLVHTKCAIYYLSAPKQPFIACSMKTDLDPSHMIFLLAATLLNFLSRGHKWDRKSGKGFISWSQLLCFCTIPNHSQLSFLPD